jgi:C1A family cysteine protease
MRRSSRSLPILDLLLALVVAVVAAVAVPAAQAVVRTPSAAPLNPAFVAFQHNVAATAAHGTFKALVPAPVNSRSWAKAPLALGPLALATSYDLRDTGKLSLVRDQGDYNTCWSFASLASLESYLLPGDPEDFSEDNLAMAAAGDFDFGFNGGGNYQMATAELTRWNGPVAEASDPYDAKFVAGLAPIEHVQNVLFLPDRNGPTDNDTIKYAVENYGAVYASIYADSGMSSSSTSPYFNAANDSYYYDGSATADHAIDIVGWNDDYSRTNFSTEPTDNGAFIVRNSWGSDWGKHGGYFYVSYDDVVIGHGMAVFQGEPTTDYAQNFGYDKLGFTDAYGYGSDTAWMAADFVPRGDSFLGAASFYAQSPNTAYDIYLASSLDDHSTWSEMAAGTVAAAGYQTIPFATQPKAAAGVRFYMIVELTSPTTTRPIAVEDVQKGYSSKATAAADESYISADGSSGSWIDLGAHYAADVCLRVFAGEPTPDAIAPVTKALAAVKVTRNRYANLRYRVSDATANDKEKVTIKIRNRTGHVVKTFALGWRAPNVAQLVRYRCTLARGTYHYYVYATDFWGNPQTSVGHAALTVK